jgi:hypothetical protein
MESVLYDAAGHPRSPATLPGSQMADMRPMGSCARAM